MAARFQAIQAEHGADSVAFLSTGQIATEEMALLGAVAKFGMGMVHGDGNTRQCMASAVVAYKQAFGFDAPPYTYQDLEESDCIVLIGANPCIAHPILWERVTRNPHQPGDHRRRPAPDRDGDGGHAPPAGPPQVRPDAPVRPRAPLDRAGRDRPPLHRRPHPGFDEFAAFVRRFDPAVRGARDRPGRRDDRRRRRADRAGRAGLVLVDDGGEPEPPGGQDGPGRHQPGA